jgi:RNA polymerase sigma-70 factor, ECF subfamily
VDQDAKIYQEHRFTLVRYATGLVGPNDAPDIVSAVMIRVLERRGGLSGLRQPLPYLMKSILNEVRSRHRRASSVRMIPLEDDHTPVEEDHPDELIEVVRDLPPRQRAATFLVYWEQHTPTEAARLMGCRPATVRRYLHLARRKLEEALDA